MKRMRIRKADSGRRSSADNPASAVEWALLRFFGGRLLPNDVAHAPAGFQLFRTMHDVAATRPFARSGQQVRETASNRKE